MDDEYTLMPEGVVDQLKSDLNNLKRKAAEENISGTRSDLMTGMDKLSGSITTLIELFKTATDSMKMEEQEATVLSKKIDPLMDRLDTIIDQNQQIAQGIVAVADMIKDNPKPAMGAPSMPPPRNETPVSPFDSKPPMGMKPVMVPPRGLEPKPLTPPPMTPPMPPRPQAKKGMFGLFKK